MSTVVVTKITMLTNDQIRAALADRNLREVSRRIEIHPNTLSRIRKGAAPSYQTARILSEYLTNG